jgi:subtilisin family serine protease
MPDPSAHLDAAGQRLVPEVRAGLAAAEAEGLPIRVWPPDWERSRQIEYFYRPRSLLARDEDAPRVAQALREIPPLDGERRAHDGGRHAVDPSGTPIKGVMRFPVAASDDQQGAGESVHLESRVLEQLEGRLGVGVVGPEHVFEITRWVHCPATEPEPVLTPEQARDVNVVEQALWPPIGDPLAGRGVRVSVVDTGLLRGVAGWAPWLAGVTADSAADIENPDTFDVATHRPGRDGYADPYAGHGSFIAGVIRCVAPAAEVVVERLIGKSGFVAETDMITQIQQGLSRSPDIVNVSAGGYTRRDVPPAGLRALWDHWLSQQGGVVVVAAAGNNNSSRPFWPAAFDWCVGVGSMSRDGQRRSWFTNNGSWVDVFAPGEDIVNAYPRRQYMTFADKQIRDTSAGIVRWSGTSFATPIVAAAIAARMSRTGENGRTAAANVLRTARGQFRPDVGPRLFP